MSYMSISYRSAKRQQEYEQVCIATLTTTKKALENGQEVPQDQLEWCDRKSYLYKTYGTWFNPFTMKTFPIHIRLGILCMAPITIAIIVLGSALSWFCEFVIIGGYYWFDRIIEPTWTIDTLREHQYIWKRGTNKDKFKDTF